MKIRIEIDADKLRRLVSDYIESVAGDIPFSANDVRIEVKSRQNYRSEWESADFRAVIDLDART